MWIQDWSGKITTGFGTRVFWNWRWNETWYPDLDTVIQATLRRKYLNVVTKIFVGQELGEEGVKVTVYLTPHLNTDGDVYQAGAADQANWLTDSTTNTTLLQVDRYILHIQGVTVTTSSIVYIININNTTRCCRTSASSRWPRRTSSGPPPTATASIPAGGWRVGV